MHPLLVHQGMQRDRNTAAKLPVARSERYRVAIAGFAGIDTGFLAWGAWGPGNNMLECQTCIIVDSYAIYIF